MNTHIKTFLITISVWLACLTPALAETLKGQISRSAARDSATLDASSTGASLKEEGAVEVQQQDQQNGQTQSLSGQVEHGELPVGVLGCQILVTLLDAKSAVIAKIYPGSDLLRYGIKMGDRIVGVNGHRFMRRGFSEECRGAPGTTINLVISRGGQETELAVMRKDAREFASYERYYRKWAAATKYW